MRACLISMVLLMAAAGLVLAQEEFVFKNYNLEHVKLKDPGTHRKIETEIRKVLSEKGSLILDARTNTVMVGDYAANQNDVARVIARLDVGSRKTGKTVWVTVDVSHVEASVAEEALQEAMKEDVQLSGLQISHSDETGKLVLVGTLDQVEKAKALIAALEEKFRSQVETKTYKIRNRSAKNMAQIVKLHLAGGPGTGVAIDEVTNSLIVRETKANQVKVKEVIAKFDTELATVVLEFRVIYASRDATGIDESIKDVAEELKDLFDFTRYRAQGSLLVKVEQGHSVEFKNEAAGLTVSLERCDYDPDKGRVRIDGLRVVMKMEETGGKPLSVKITPKVKVGHPVVFAASKSKDARSALIVVVKVTIEK